MRTFLDDNFLLYSETAQRLFNEYAKDMPIIDYHCHLSPQEIWENKSFRNLTDAWLSGDHYKWRVMRANGVTEPYVTGDASDWEKFLAWSRTVPMTIGNPLYHWTHLELQRFFNVTELLNEESAESVWSKVNAKLTNPGFSARDLIVKSNVEVVCTTDDPADTLEYHIKLQQDPTFPVRVLPSFRPDKALNLNRSGFTEWVTHLSTVSDMPIQHYSDLLDALDSRIQFFHSIGGRLSDHALDYVPFEEASLSEVSLIFEDALAGRKVSLSDEMKYKTYTLLFLGRRYAQLGWTMQFHINALRSVNHRMVSQLGPDTGYDSINDTDVARPLARLLNALEEEDALPKTILYSVNAAKDNDVLAAMVGNFQGGGIPGKIQLGAAWWFNDTIDGMTAQMKSLANIGLLSQFVGMLTDSRSFLSYPRHEYFRRILCNILGTWVEHGEAPNDLRLLGTLVQRISYHNAKAYFSF